MNQHGGNRQGAGGPPGPRLNTATTHIQVRLTEHEKSVFKARSAALGLTISEYVKLRCISGK